MDDDDDSTFSLLMTTCIHIYIYIHTVYATGERVYLCYIGESQKGDDGIDSREGEKGFEKGPADHDAPEKAWWFLGQGSEQSVVDGGDRVTGSRRKRWCVGHWLWSKTRRGRNQYTI